MFKLTALLFITIGLHSTAMAAPNSELPAKKSTTAPPAQNTEVDDTEDQFFQEEPEEEPIDENADDAAYQQDEPAEDGVETNQNPDDEGIEYAAEAEKNEAERQKKIQEQKRALQKPKPPVDEPMPLIKRQRETVQLKEQQPNKWIRHPYAKKGLVKITRDKVYIYKVKHSDQTRASSVRFGMFTPTKLTNPDTGVVYEDFYPGNNFSLQYDYEWQLFRRFGKLGVKLGTGLATAQGNGQFKNSLNGDLTPKEKLTFLVLPNTAGAILRLQFWDRQLLVPYAEGGGAAFAFGEMRDDGKSPKFGGAFGGYFALGLAMNLHFFDPLSMLELDREYSINNVYLTGEYRYYVGTGNFDFTGDMISGGVTMEF